MNVLISLDGASHKAFARYAKRFVDRGFSHCEKLITTFPSVTFHAHATAITGNRHNQHLVIDNVVAHSETLERTELYHDHKILCNEALHKQTLFYSLHQNGVKSCCIHWPLTSGNRYIEHLVTESGSKKRLQGGVSPEDIDHVAYQETLQAIESGAYPFIAARFVGYDALSHQHGKDSVEAIACLERLLEQIGHIADALETLQRPYNLIVFSDHGQSDVRTFFYPNEILAQSRWRKHLFNNQLRFVGDGSGALLFYSVLDEKQNKEIMAYFNGMPEVHHFHERTWESRLSFQPVGILDLNQNVCGEDIMPTEEPKYKEMKSLHGYHPANVDEMNGFMVCIGNQLAKSKRIEQAPIESIAPTVAALFHISHPCGGSKLIDMMGEHE